MFHRILAATDLVTTVDAPVLTAARLARHHNARLDVLHVMESSSLSNRRLVRHYATDEERLADADYEQSVAQALRQTYGDVLAGINVSLHIGAGFPWEAILHWSARIDADLIVMGPHSTRSQEKGVVRIAGKVGSTVAHVMTHETCPVMIARHPAEEDLLHFRRVLIPVDFSRSCECAICFAARLAARCHSRLLVFHMMPVPPVPKYSREAYARDKNHARERLDAFYTTYLDGIDHRFLIRAGAVPHLEILKAAEEHQADLIIMGSHTKETSGKWYPGSAVERVAYRAACPVAVITDPQVLIRWDGRLSDDQSKTADRWIHVFTGT